MQFSLRALLRAFCLCLALWVSGLVWGTPARAQVDVLTYHNDNARTGRNLAETALTPQTVNSAQFGRLFSVPTDGYVYAQPLYVSGVNVPGKGVHNLLLVATEHDSVYAFDADAKPAADPKDALNFSLWKRVFVDPNNGITTVPSADTDTGDIVPEIGITGTPTIALGAPDANGNAVGTLYVVVKTKEVVGGKNHYLQRLHALDLATGQDVTTPAVIGDTTYDGSNYGYVSGPSVAGSGDGSVNGSLTFNALREHQRGGLVLTGNVLYLPYASHGDNGPYHGWVLAYRADTLAYLGSFNTSPNGGLSGIWMSGEAPAVDTDGSLFLITGNGTFSADRGGSDFGESFLKLSPTLGLSDYFTAHNQDDLNARDADLGSGGLILLPDEAGGGGHAHLLAGCGKDGIIYLLDRDHLTTSNQHYDFNGDHVVQEVGSDGTWSSPAYWNGALYYQGAYGALKRFPIKGGLLDSNAVSQSQDTAAFPGATPCISADGNGGGIVWTVQTDAYSFSGPAILHAHDALNPAVELYNSNQSPARDNPGPAVKFVLPVIANGKVYVGAQYQVSVYGLNPPPIAATPTITASGTGVVGDTVTLADATPGASIYYTTDGSDPTGGSRVYIAPFRIAQPMTLKARAILPGFLDSAVASRFFGRRGSDGHGDGLGVTYFTGVNLDPTEGTTVHQVDKKVDFSKDNGPQFPDGSLGQDNFSARWVGQVQPRFSETYTFTTVSDDGVRLWVNGQMLVDDWTYHGSTEDSGTITLRAGGRYDIKMEFFQGGGGAEAHLLWASASQQRQVIPQSQLYSGAPDPVTTLAATAGDSKVLLTWTASPGATGYTIKRRDGAAGPFQSLTPNGPVAGTTFTDTGVVNGHTYYYLVNAVNAYGTSADGNQASATPARAGVRPPAPANLQAVAGNAQVALFWDSLPAAAGYNIYRGKTPGGEVKINGAALTANSYRDTGLVNGQVYFYKVSAVNAVGEGPLSSEVHATPLPPVISDPNGFADDSDLQLNGSAQISGSRLRLTDGANWEAASAFRKHRVGVSQFVTDFQFQLGNPDADGITFCLQDVAPTALGGVGGGLGFYQIGTPSVAVKFDLWDNEGEGTNSTGLFLNGVNPTVGGQNVQDISPVNLHSGDVIAVHMSYDGATLTVTETDTQTQATAAQTYTVDLAGLLGPQAYPGFTGATGGAGVVADILNWTYDSISLQAPVVTTIAVSPPTAALLGGQTLAYTATALDQNDAPLSTQPSFAWSVDDGGVGSVDAGGLYHAGSTAGIAVVRATASGVSGTAAVTVSAPPQAPLGLTAQAASPHEIDLAWTNTDNEQTSVKVERSLDGIHFTLLATLAANAARYADLNLSPATTYTYRVRGSDDAGDSAPSATAQATTPDVPPLQASNLKVKTASATELDLTWTDNSDNEAGFHLYRKAGTGGTFSLDATAPRNATSYQDRGLAPGTYYEYHLKAYNAVGEAADFAGAHGTTLAAPPASLTATVGRGQIALSWPASAGATSYNVYRGATSGGEGAAPIKTGLTAPGWTDTGVASGQFYYQVTAVDDGGESAGSPEANAGLISGAGLQLRVTASASRDPASGDVAVTLTLTNVGPSITSMSQVTAARLGGRQTTTSLPAKVSAIAPGASAVIPLRFPGSAGAKGTRQLLQFGMSFSRSRPVAGIWLTMP